MKIIELPHPDLYLKQLGLNANPFPISPDAHRYFLTHQLQTLVHEVLFCIQQRKGFVVITGEVGLGKTTFSRFLIEQLRARETEVAVLFNTVLQEGDLIEQICSDYDLNTKGLSLREQIQQLDQFFIEKRRQGKNCVLFIDDAQNLSKKSLEVIRVLSNLETDREKLVQVVLLGQPELSVLLDSHDLRQLKSRVALLRQINPLNREELAAYITYKLNICSDGTPIEVKEDASNQIYRYSKGNLRRANLLLDRVVLALIGQHKTVIDRTLVHAAYWDLDPKGEKSLSNIHATSSPMKRIVVAFPITVFLLGFFWTFSDVEAKNNFFALFQKNGGSFKNLFVETGVDVPNSKRDQSVVEKDLLNEESAEKSDSGGSSVNREKERSQVTPVMVRANLHDREKLVKYLSEFGLGSEVDLVVQYLNEQNMSELAANLLAPRGLSLLRNAAQLPLEKIDIATITVKSVDGRNEELIIWEPEFIVGELNYFKKSEAISELQNRLSFLGYYQGKIDGLVGTLTFSAIMAFQKNWELPVTGQVDEYTLFLLHCLVTK